MALPTLLLSYPFVLTILAGGLAGASAILLRRAGLSLGRWADALAGLLGLGAALAFAWSYFWAWSLSEPSREGASLFMVGLGWLLVLAGAALAAVALSVGGVRALLSGPSARASARLPYRRVRRPLPAGLMLVAFGVSMVGDTLVLWVCFLLCLVLTHLLLELWDWEVCQRHPGLREYFERTPRYLPRLRPRA